MKKLLVLAVFASFVACSNTSDKTTVTDTTASASSLKTDAVNPAVSGDTTTSPAAGSSTTASATDPAATTAPATGQPTPAQAQPKPASGGAAAEIKKGEALIAKSDCLVCHKLNEKLIGPSYADVAKKYPNTPANITHLADKIIKGGGGVWGDMAMTPHPTLSMDDAKALAQYVLSIK